MDLFCVFIKGIWIGATLSIPGISGGSMAMILGIYEKLILSFNKLFQKGEKKKESFLFILVFSLGALTGLFAISGLVVRLLKQYPLPISFLFAGAVLGGMRVIFHEINREILKASDILYPLIGIAIVLSIASLPSGLVSFENSGPFQWLLQIAIGIVAAVALVLPGISISQVLYVLGMYTLIFEHLSRFSLLPLIPFAMGLLSGVIFISKALEDLLIRFRKETFLVTLGFVGGSVIELLQSVSYNEFGFHCILLLMIGFIPIFMISKKERVRQE